MINLAQLEKNLANTDLNQFKQEPQKLLVKQIYKHQLFKRKVILTRINRMHFSEGTVNNYITIIKKYLQDGSRKKGYGTVYNIIDELVKNHEGILQPSAMDKALLGRGRKSKEPKPLTPPTPIEPPKYIEKIPPQYGIKCGDWIRLQPSKEMALGYIECYKVIGDGKPVELVTIDLEVVQ